MLRRAWERWRIDDPSLPADRSELFEKPTARTRHVSPSSVSDPSETRFDLDEEITLEFKPAELAPAHPSQKIVLPSGTKPSEAPPDHLGVIPVSPGFVFITSDHHHPISDRYAEDAVVQCARDLKPHTWIFSGDLLDCWWISLHAKESERLLFADAGPRIVDELDSFRPLGKEALSICDQVHICEGNHEHRLGRLIDANPGLHGLPGLKWSALFDLPGAHFWGYGYRLKIGPLGIIHGDRISNSKFGPKHPTAWLMDNRGTRSTVFGHTHRLGMSHKTIWDEYGQQDYVAINGGHLSETRLQTYQHEPNWQTGMVIVEMWTHGGKLRFTPHMVQIIDGTFSFAGRVYSGRKLQ